MTPRDLLRWPIKTHVDRAYDSATGNDRKCLEQAHNDVKDALSINFGKVAEDLDKCALPAGQVKEDIDAAKAAAKQGRR